MTRTEGQVIQRGEKVVLRTKTADDAKEDYEWRIDPELATYDAAYPLRMSFQDYLTLHAEELQFPSPFRRTFAIDDLEGKHIGNVMYYNFDERRGEAELGITIGDRNYWSRGYGTDAVRALVTYLFRTTNLRRIYLHTLEWNVRAQRAFTKAGFTPIGTVRRGGNTFVQMEIRRDDWEARNCEATE